jgi:LysM repeat protein
MVTGGNMYAITPQRRALLNTIRFSLGTWANGADIGYQMTSGGGLASLDTYPGGGKVIGGTLPIEGAGAYHISPATWALAERVLSHVGFDFSPQAQDQVALFRIDCRGALVLADKGVLSPDLLKLLAEEWPSFTSPASSNNSIDDSRYAPLRNFYNRNLAELGGVAACKPYGSTQCRYEKEALKPAQNVLSSELVKDATVVRLGDNLVKIAQRYKITVNELLRLNPSFEVDKLVVGTHIQLPGTTSANKSENKSQSSTSSSTNVTQQPGSSSLYAWRLDSNGVLELRTRPRALLIASMEYVNDALVGSRVWIDLPGPPSLTTSIPGSGAVHRVRIGRPDDKTTRLVVEFKPGTSPDQRRLRLIGTSADRWRMDFGLRAAPSAPIGQGQI